MKTVLLVLIVFCFCPYLARGDTDIFPASCSVPVPDISGWEVGQTSRIEFRLSDETVAYLGLDVEHRTYRNPDSGEFMKVFSRHIPLIPSRPKQTNERVIADVATELYVQKDEKDRLGELNKKMDSFLYVYWRIQKNSRNGNDMLDGDVDIWFTSFDGSCHFMQNEPIGIQFLSENVGNGKPRNVFVGVKYQVGDVYHILKIDRRDVSDLMEREK
ncbi:MAG: hypothetical protein HY505_02575 [Candidatus Yanofskybacteria bacterium]|nr:hypothetical protein [Candidatus Yanofskybacteria bacterium]